MTIICFDYGHGGLDPGAVYGKRKEKDDNLLIGKSLAEKLRKHGFIVDEVRENDETMSLQARVNFERWKEYDLFISFHRNAYRPEEARGVETYTYLKAGKRASELAERIQDALKNVGFVDRGIKRANYYVLRKTRSPAILLEIGFIDNSGDNKIFEEKKEEIVRGIFLAILKSF